MKKDRRDFLKIMTSCALTTSLVPLSFSCKKQKSKPDTKGISKKSKAEEALSLMQEYGSCCTGVLAAYAPEFGLDKNLAAGLGRGMAGGISGLGSVCGAVSGAVMVIGLQTTNENNVHDMEAGFKTMQKVNEFVDRFKEQHASIKCRDLIGHDISTMEKREAAMKDNAFANCPRYVQSAANILNDIFSSEKT